MSELIASHAEEIVTFVLLCGMVAFLALMIHGDNQRQLIADLTRDMVEKAALEVIGDLQKELRKVRNEHRKGREKIASLEKQLKETTKKAEAQ